MNFEKRFARGGVGAIITSHVPIDVRGRILPNYAFIDNDPEKVRFWKRVGDEVRAIDGCKFILQLSYSGRQQDIGGIENWRRKPLTPTGRPDYFQKIGGRRMSTDEIRGMVASFVAAARRVNEAGLDGIELHSGNGYLFTQFLSEAINDRADEYGGTLERRFLFLRQVIEGIRSDADLKDMPLIVKLSGVDRNNDIYGWKHAGTTIDESIQIAKWCEEAGADAIHVSTGSMFAHPWNPAGYLPGDFAQLFLLLSLAFGIGYALVGFDIDRNHGVVAMGVVGQVSVFTIVFWQWTRGNVYLVGLVPGLIDLAFALAFVRFLWRYDYDRIVART